MRVLDLDLDFFLDGVVHRPAPGSRPTATSIAPWSTDRVREFLETQCGLDANRPVPAKKVETHDEVFDCWLTAIQLGELRPPFEVVHVDAHADLGMGDSGYVFLLTRLLSLPPTERPANVRPTGVRGMCAGNYLAFAIACRWIDSLTYVKHPAVRDDLLGVLFRDRDKSAGAIQLPHYEESAALTFMRQKPSPIALEPEVPFSVIPAGDFSERRPYDFAFLAVSRDFVPVEAEALIDVIGEYLCFAK